MNGDIIGCTNKETRDTVLFPRGVPFITQLSGMVIGQADMKSVTTQCDLTKEIRRGDAIRLGETWYRVSSAVGAKSNDPIRAKAPLSVTSIQDMSDRNIYIDTFNESTLPLNGEMVDSYSGNAYKHGCTNDLRDLWQGTLENVKLFRNSDMALQEELLRLRLVTRDQTQSLKKSRSEVVNLDDNSKSRKKIRRRELKITNTHLKGTEMGNILAKAAKTAMSS